MISIQVSLIGEVSVESQGRAQLVLGVVSPVI